MSDSLAGKRVVVTRPAEQAESFAQQLCARGAEVIAFPTIRIEKMPDPGPMKAALSNLADYDWVIFTSVNGVERTWELLTCAWPRGTKVAAIGPATAAALEGRGVPVDYVPDVYVAERIVDGIVEVSGKCILLPRAARARPALAERLRERGAQVTEVAAYQTLVNRPSKSAYAALNKGADAITFTSASTVEGFTQVAQIPDPPTVIACIGPITAQAASKLGLEVDIMADKYTTAGLLEALEGHFAHS